MKFRSIFLTVVFTIIIPLPALAQNWYYVGDGLNGKLVRLIDKDSIRKSGTTVKVWSLTLLKDYEPRIRGGNSTRQQWSYNCKDETQRVLFLLVSRDGEVVFTNNQPETQIEPVIPGSLDSMGFEFACGKKTNAIDVGNPAESQMRNVFFGQ